VENTIYDENKRSDIYTHHTYHTRIQLTMKFLKVKAVPLHAMEALGGK
jgi:hypothetical protein